VRVHLVKAVGELLWFWESRFCAIFEGIFKSNSRCINDIDRRLKRANAKMDIDTCGFLK